MAGTEVYAATPKEERAQNVIAFIRRMNQELYEATGGRHARFFKEAIDKDGKKMVPKEKLPDISGTALRDGSIFYNPEDLDYNDFLMVMEAAWEGNLLDICLIRKG
jgi:alcohol dehydrogenase